MQKYLSLFVFTFFLGGFALAQTPTNNPYFAAKGSDAKHWSQHLNWERTIDISTVPNLVQANYAVDSTLFYQQVQQMAEGGGVLYFPPGIYYFTYDLMLPSGVILRGANPQFADLATQEEAYLATHFHFPACAPGAPSFVSTDFEREPDPVGQHKRIELAAANTERVALVYLDINRGIIDFSSKAYDRAVDKDWLKTGHKDLLLLGLRVNNASVADPGLPTAFQVEHNQGWQRWPWDLAANINLTAKKNAAVLDCWINNAPTDSYRQNNYMLDDGMTFDGYDAEYKVTDHPGIAINYPAAAGMENHKSFRSIEVSANRIAVTKGNEGFVGIPTPLLRNNKVSIIQEKENLIVDGRRVDAFDYNLLYADAELAKAGTHSNQFGYSLNYRYVEPERVDENEKYPLVLFLHDFTSKGTDNRSQLRHFLWQMATPEARGDFPCYIVAPQLTHDENLWRARYNFSYTFPLQVCEQIVEEFCQKYPVDRDRIYLVGAGVGGDSVWDLAIYNPDTFAALACFGGAYHFDRQSAKQIAHLPIWMIWGEDDEWLPQERRQLTLVELQLAGAKGVKVLNIPRMGKKCWNRIVEQEPDFLPWLFRQKRDASFSAK
ncbi:MAG: dienelactone hydrolase family protein [Bacteroidota bacterium]